MKLFLGILFGCFSFWFCEQTSYRFWTKYAFRKNQILTSCQLENNWFYNYFFWIPFDSWSLPPESLSETESLLLQKRENKYSKSALSYLRPFRDDLYDYFWSDHVGFRGSFTKFPIPGGFLVRSPSLVPSGNSQIILTLTNSSGGSIGGDFKELSMESSILLDHGIDFALATVNNFGEVLDVVGYLVGSNLDDTGDIAVCAYGEQADLLALAMAHSPQLFAAVALLSPMGDAPIDRLKKAEYPPVLFAARASDEESIRSNALLWANTCRRLSTSRNSRVLCMIPPTMHQETFSDIKLKTLAHAFLIDSLATTRGY